MSAVVFDILRRQQRGKNQAARRTDPDGQGRRTHGFVIREGASQFHAKLKVFTKASQLK